MSTMKDYSSSKKKMDDYLDHLDNHTSPKVKWKAMIATKDFGDKQPDRVEKLKDENISLKKN
jgi:hypothetical protein